MEPNGIAQPYCLGQGNYFENSDLSTLLLFPPELIFPNVSIQYEFSGVYFLNDFSPEKGKKNPIQFEIVLELNNNKTKANV